MKKIELFRPERLVAVPVPIYAAMVSNLVAAGADQEMAEKLADAALGPLRLVPPAEELFEDDYCQARLFTVEGEWKSCGEEPGHEPVKLHHDRFDETVSWDDDDPRAISKDYV